MLLVYLERWQYDHSRKVMPQGEDIGFVGKITHVDTTLINTLLDQGYTPIVSTIGLDENIMLIILMQMMLLQQLHALLKQVNLFS